MAASCVFCGRLIGEADSVTGRPPNVAHAACADAALADDAHWDAVAAASGDESAAEPEPSRDGGAKPRRAGCLTLACLLAALMTAAALAVVS